MHIDISKSCADYLRAQYNSVQTVDKLKATHARELVAAFFGYKSHAALKADKLHPVDDVFHANLVVPDVPLMRSRAKHLSGLPERLTSTEEIATHLADHLKDSLGFEGSIWVYDSLENFVLEKLLPNQEARFYDYLSGQMAETNAYFDELYFEDAQVSQDLSSITINAEGTFHGESDPDKPFSGDTINVKVDIEFYKAAGHRAFSGHNMEVDGEVNYDWVDPMYR